MYCAKLDAERAHIMYAEFNESRRSKKMVSRSRAKVVGVRTVVGREEEGLYDAIPGLNFEREGSRVLVRR